MALESIKSYQFPSNILAWSLPSDMKREITKLTGSVGQCIVTPPPKKKKFFNVATHRHKEFSQQYATVEYCTVSKGWLNKPQHNMK